MKMALTKERRRQACVHEAAHAVIFALGNQCPWKVCVAPVGSVEWTHVTDRGRVQTDLWGVCAASDQPISPMLLRWDEAAWRYVFDKKTSEEIWGLIGATCTAHLLKKTRAEERQRIRAFVLGLMAGPLADLIIGNHLTADEITVWQEPGWEITEDLTRAFGLTEALPFRSEYDDLLNLTLRTLREPEIWAAVVRLADALEIDGVIEDGELEVFLPDARKDWPRKRDMRIG